MRSSLIIAFFLQALQITRALQQGFSLLPKFPQFFQPIPSGNANGQSRQEQESVLLEAISNTQNGKTATVPQQREILRQVASLETNYPPPPISDIISSGDIDGTWYLQFTSPSEIEDVDDEGGEESGSTTWTVENSEENITTKKFNAKGSISFSGVEVDVTNKPPRQIFDVNESTIYNEVVLERAFVRIGGTFRESEKNDRRIVVSFQECMADLKFIKLDLAFLFDVLAFVRGTKDLGWLETTYISDSVRIGRGNKGSMFILTRDEGAVVP